MTLEFIMLLSLTVLPIFYKMNLWVYLFEQKKFSSNFWNQKLFNFWFPIELLFFVLSFSLFYDSKLEIIFFPIFFYFLTFYNIFVVWKVIRWNLEEITSCKKYVYIWLCLYFLDISTIIYFFENKFLYIYILFIFLLAQIIYIYLFYQAKILKSNKKKL